MSIHKIKLKIKIKKPNLIDNTMKSLHAHSSSHQFPRQPRVFQQVYSLSLALHVFVFYFYLFIYFILISSSLNKHDWDKSRYVMAMITSNTKPS